jgi:hypothetical protein
MGVVRTTPFLIFKIRTGQYVKLAVVLMAGMPERNGV